jgi:hypothetical protein
MGRTWSLNAAYDRNVGFVESFAAPFFYDSASVGLNGLLSRRLDVHANAGVMRGNLGFGDGAIGNDFDSDYATAGIGTALNRFVSIGVDYSFYRYYFDQNGLLPAGFNHDLSRHSVRATLSAGAPLFQSRRRRNATR